jgi:excinuclease ABC subunit A
MKAAKHIRIIGANKHNLCNVSLDIPRDALVVFTGVSGSGKTSLAFDTVYAEGQRRYFETLSTFTRQFVAGMERADVDLIEGLSPSISVDQKGMPTNPRSTVGTVTEIYDYLRLLFTAVGIPHCPEHNLPIQSMSPERIADTLFDTVPDQTVMLLAPAVQGRKGVYKDLIEKIARKFTRLRVDGTLYSVDDEIPMSRYKAHDIEIVIDRGVVVEEASRARLVESLITCAGQGEGSVLVRPEGAHKDLSFSTRRACPACGMGLPRFSPPMFAFNSPQGACPTCNGLGMIDDFSEDAMIPDPELSFLAGGIAPVGGGAKAYDSKLIQAALDEIGFSAKDPLGRMTAKQKEQLFYGTGNTKYQIRYKGTQGHWRFATAPFRGVCAMLRDKMDATMSERVRERLASYRRERTCPSCGGGRLKPESLSVKINGKGIFDLASAPVIDTMNFLAGLKLTKKEKQIGGGLLGEVLKRLQFIDEVGLSYLTLDRHAGSLSGGEYQRVRLAAQIGTYLSGVTYVLDEPSVGLHPRDCSRLLDTLCRLRDLGNSVIVIEHDELTMSRADHIVDMGPRAGRLGGHVVAQGTMAQLKKNPDSLTGQYLSGAKTVPVPLQRRSTNGSFITLKGASGNNLKNVDLEIPLGTFTCITGVSGSGKSSLILDTLHPAVLKHLGQNHQPPLPYISMDPGGAVDRVLMVDASPIGKTSRSTPATYTGVFNEIRNLFAQLPESRARGYAPGRFSYNVAGGRCETCEGNGDQRIEMHFLPDVSVTCPTCNGRRYNRETLEVTFKGKSIANVLDMTAEEALEVFENIPKIRKFLEIINDIGLGYLRLGQPGPSLSAGEAQRIKLASELKIATRKKTLYLLDEPTTGLHFSDINKLLNVITRLVDKGNTAIVIEHNLDIIKAADWIIDLGPEGGSEGGTIIAQGPPEKIAKEKKSHTAGFIRDALKRK